MTKPEGSPVEAAGAWLVSVLDGGGWREAEAIEAERAAAGVSARALITARGRLVRDGRVEKRKAGRGAWSYRLVGRPAPEAPAAPRSRSASPGRPGSSLRTGRWKRGGRTSGRCWWRSQPSQVVAATGWRGRLHWSQRPRPRRNALACLARVPCRDPLASARPAPPPGRRIDPTPPPRKPTLARLHGRDGGRPCSSRSGGGRGAGGPAGSHSTRMEGGGDPRRPPGGRGEGQSAAGAVRSRRVTRAAVLARNASPCSRSACIASAWR